MPLKCIIIDDEPLPIVLLTDYIQKTPFLQLAGAYTNPLEALDALRRNNVDLVFLDIQMPELNGVEFVQFISERSKIIFTTAYPNYALQGFELNVLDYLLKPISFERFLKAVNKANQVTPEGAVPNGASLLSSASPPSDVLFVKVEHKIIRVLTTDILYIEGLKEYVAIHTREKKIITLQSMKKMEEILPPTHFFRIHKSYIVAFDKIDFIERNRVFVNTRPLPVGETYKDSFFERINKRNLI